MLLHDHEFVAIKKKIDQGAEPWTSAFKTVIRQADEALAQPPLSILDNGLNSRYFRQDAVYVPGLNTLLYADRFALC